MIALISRNSVSGFAAKLSIHFARVITLILQLLLDIHNHLIGWQVGITVYRAIPGVDPESRIIAPGREPIAAIPIVVTAIHQHDAIVMPAPPPPVMPGTMIAVENGMGVSPTQTA